MSANVHESENLGRLVKARRRGLGLTQDELSDLSGVSRRTISALENGKDSIQLDRLTAVLAVLGLMLEVREAGQ
jgi:y4mF family transcriptional regulator